MSDWSWLSFVAGVVAVVVGFLLLLMLAALYVVVALIRRGKQERNQTQIADALRTAKERFQVPPPPDRAA